MLRSNSTTSTLSALHEKRALIAANNKLPAQKKWGSRLGPGAPRRRVPLSVSFSYRRVGSSILASLSEAGGNDLQKMASKPLPPHSPLPTYRHVKTRLLTGLLQPRFQRHV